MLNVRLASNWTFAADALERRFNSSTMAPCDVNEASLVPPIELDAAQPVIQKVLKAEPTELCSQKPKTGKRNHVFEG